MPRARPGLLILVGSTASGKTGLSIEWAEWLGAEIISADSVQIYRYMDIGTAKPPPEVRRRVPHHLLDVVDPDETFSAAQFQRRADRAIQEIHARGKIPMLVGGTGLYIRALMRGLFKGGGRDEALRRRLQEEARARGSEVLHRRLRRIDPQAAGRIHPNDLFRIVRALEVFLATGVPISQHQRMHGFARRRYPALWYGISIDRATLYQRIARRADEMLERGLVEEVEALMNRGYDRTLPAMRTIGYRHIGQFLSGEVCLSRAVSSMKRDTKHYARRQMTWFRAMPEVRWFSPEEKQKVLGEIRRLLDEHLGTGGMRFDECAPL